MILDLLAPLIVGFVGSLHCLGMCGPLVVAYSLHMRSTSPRRKARRYSISGQKALPTTSPFTPGASCATAFSAHWPPHLVT